LTYTVRGGTVDAPGVASLYVDGRLVATNNSITSRPGRLGEPDGATSYNWLGRSAYPGDNSFKGTLRDFRVYPRELSQDEVTARMRAKAQEAVDAVQLADAGGVRGNLTLPTTGPYGSTLAWSSSDPGVVTATGEVTRPAHGEHAVTVTLTVAGTLGGVTATRDIPVTVLPMPAVEPFAGYTFPYFAGESTADGEKIYVAASHGDDPLTWDQLNDGKPVLASTMGEQGLRDPFIMRSHEGDKFYLLATDLKIYGGNTFSEAQESGSTSLMIWESTDLVHWGSQRMVRVSSDYAGNTWAPEAFYDDGSGQYVVYWASNLYPTTDVASRDYTTSYNGMMYATTRDFRTFSEARPWVDVTRGTGRGMIDATVVRDGDTFYRFIKDEASMTVREERSTDLMAVVTGSLPTTTSSPWTLVREQVGVGQPNPWGGTFTNGEGPTVYRDNHDPARWYMLIDQPSYHGGRGYMAFTTDDIGSGDWTSLPEAQLPPNPRHGSVIPVTQTELDALRGALQPGLLATSGAAVTVTTRQGVAPALPTTVPVTYADGSTRATAVTWDPVAADDYASWGGFEVHGTLDGGQVVRATGIVRVTDAADPTVVLATDPATPDGTAGWFRHDVTVEARAADEAGGSGVDDVELSLDGGAWSSAAGGTTTLGLPYDGRHTVRARSVDVSGNMSATAEVSVLLDRAPAVSRAVWDDASRTIAIRAADDTSGVSRVEYQVDDETTWHTYGAPLSFGVEASVVRYRAVDVAGNTEQTNTLFVPRGPGELDATTTSATMSKSGVRVGTPVTVGVTVSGGTRTPAGTVRVLAGGDLEVGRGELAGGSVTVAVDTRALGVGKWPLTVVYGGDANHAGSQTTVELRVTK
ncbi:MAG TPA: immunoglobulin-like domain-containing protein, partial [Kribbellaceae bacterium]